MSGSGGEGEVVVEGGRMLVDGLDREVRRIG